MNAAPFRSLTIEIKKSGQRLEGGGVRKFIFLFILLALGILQLTALDNFKIFNIKPDLLLLSVIIVSLTFQLREALFLSIFAGVFKDSLVTSAFGINTLLFAFWCFIIIKLSRKVTIDSSFMRICLVFIIVFLHNLIIGIIFLYLRITVALGIYLRIVFIESIYTAFILAMLFKIKWLEKRLSIGQ
jgi:rod shape-determining protein MreD